MSPQDPAIPMNWPRLWFTLFGAAQIIVGVLALLLWKINHAKHGPFNLHRTLFIGIALILLGAGALRRERITVILSSIGFTVIAIALLYVDVTRHLPLMTLLFEAGWAAVLLLPAVFSYRFRHTTRWIV